MAFYHNSKVKPHDRVDPVKLMPYEDQPVEQETDLFEALAAGML